MLYFTTQNRLQDRRSGGCEMAILCSDHGRIIVESSFLLAEALQALSPEILSLKISWQAQYWVKLEGDFDCSGNDVSYVMRIKDAIHFAWQGQYLVKLEGGSSFCSAHWK